MKVHSKMFFVLSKNPRNLQNLEAYECLEEVTSAQGEEHDGCSAWFDVETAF